MIDMQLVKHKSIPFIILEEEFIWMAEALCKFSANIVLIPGTNITVNSYMPEKSEQLQQFFETVTNGNPTMTEAQFKASSQDLIKLLDLAKEKGK
jgi:hypothetical protein